jgi:hypothetical protein
VWSNDEWAVTQGYQRHLLQAAFADRLLGDLLARLKAEGLYDESLIVVTADHGAGFRPGGPLRNVDARQFEAVMATPLVIKRPREEGGAVSDRNVETIDILPTIAAVLGMELPWPVDGVPVDGPARPFKELSYERVRVTRRFPPSMLDGVLALARRKEALFGPADAPFRHPLRAPARDLIGRAVADLPTGGPDLSPAAVLFDNSEALGSVTPADGVVPARVSGRVRWTGAPERLSLAIAVNGVIRATTRTLAPGVVGHDPARWLPGWRQQRRALRRRRGRHGWATAGGSRRHDRRRSRGSGPLNAAPPPFASRAHGTVLHARARRGAGVPRDQNPPRADEIVKRP